MDNRITLSHLWSTTKRGLAIALIALGVAILAVPEASLASPQHSANAVHLARPADGVGDSPIVP
jgi:hypothetical protein